jgi:hypothetical protein
MGETPFQNTFSGGNTHAKYQDRKPHYEGKEDKSHEERHCKRPFKGQKCAGKSVGRPNDRLAYCRAGCGGSGRSIYDAVPGFHHQHLEQHCYQDHRPFELITAKRQQGRGSIASLFLLKPKSKKQTEVFVMMTILKNKMQRIGLKVRNVLANPSGDQMTGWLIVVLIVVVVGAVFMTLYQSSITQIWNSIVTKITGLLS